LLVLLFSGEEEDDMAVLPGLASAEER
jgi:hypothetical protein